MNMEGEPAKDRRLKLEVKDLTPKQREVYIDVLNTKRKELIKSGEGRNVLSVSERQKIIDGIKAGEIVAPSKYKSPFPSVDLSKMERDFEAAGRPMKGAKDD
jgi:hypothetical protein